MRIFKLRFKSSIHIGQREGFLESIEEIIHSDTLFSAFCNAYLLLYGREKLEKLLDIFRGNPPFILSSCFPFWKEKLFFPIPLSQIPREKTLKKALFIEKEGFEELLNGRKLEDLEKNYEILPSKKYEKPYIILKNLRVALSRLNNNPGDNLFNFAELFFSRDAGLFFLLDLKDPSFEKEFISAMKLLQDEGIGGDRTAGKGLFYLEKSEEFELKIPEKPDGFLSLSLLFPEENELADLKDGFYEIIERKGYIYSPFTKSLRRKSIRGLKEGSVFLSRKKGKIVDVTPEYFREHRVYRYGFGFNIPVKF